MSTIVVCRLLEFENFLIRPLDDDCARYILQSYYYLYLCLSVNAISTLINFVNNNNILLFIDFFIPPFDKFDK